MNYVKLGNTGLQVSRFCLGCMSYGKSNVTPWPGMPSWPWTLTEEEGRPFIKRALELGVNFFDTANVYSIGESEAVLGRAIRDFARRDEMVLATKVNGPVRPDPNGRGLSRKAILSEVDQSLRRLGTDYIDLYIIHRFDYETPLEETLEALNDVVRAGKVRYLGRLVHVCVAIHEGDRPAARQRLGGVRLHAELLQSALSRGRAGNAAPVPVGGSWSDPVVAAGPRQAGASLVARTANRTGPEPTISPGPFSARRRTLTSLSLTG